MTDSETMPELPIVWTVTADATAFSFRLTLTSEMAWPTSCGPVAMPRAVSAITLATSALCGSCTPIVNRTLAWYWGLLPSWRARPPSTPASKATMISLACSRNIRLPSSRNSIPAHLGGRLLQQFQ